MLDETQEELQEVVAAAETWWTDFRNFLGQSNAVDLGIGLIVGTVFNKLVASLLEDILMPPVELLIGSTLVNLFVVLKQGKTADAIYNTVQEAIKDGAVCIFYG